MCSLSLVLRPSWGPTTSPAQAQPPTAVVPNNLRRPSETHPTVVHPMQWMTYNVHWGHFLQKQNLHFGRVLADVHKCHSSLKVSCFFSSLKIALISTYPPCSHATKTAAQ